MASHYPQLSPADFIIKKLTQYSVFHHELEMEQELILDNRQSWSCAFDLMESKFIREVHNLHPQAHCSSDPVVCFQLVTH